MTTANPLDGPFMTARQLTDYSDEPGFAILPDKLDDEAERMAREERWT